MSRRPVLLLASSSPRRRDLLEGVLGRLDTEAADVDETPRSAEAAADLVVRLALSKAQVVASHSEGRTVVGADTVVVVDGEILGKPADRDDAARMLRDLSGRSHQVMTGIAVVDRSGADTVTATTCVSTNVHFRSLDDTTITWYLASGEADDKAGAYGIQGLASLFVTKIDGNYQNVVGLPLPSLDALLGSVGHALLDFANDPLAPGDADPC